MKELTKDEIFDAQMRIRANSETFAKKVQPIFEKNNWEWSCFDTPRIPTIEDIIVTINVLSNNLYAGRCDSAVSTGRLEVRCSRDSFREQQVNVSIRLIPECQSV